MTRSPRDGVSEVDTPAPPHQWQHMRPAFTGQVESAAAALDIELAWLSHQWIAKLHRPPRTAAIVGYTFSLNNAASAQLATDKVAAYEVLRGAGLAAVEHSLIRFPWSTAGPDEVTGREIVASGALRAPMVIKPHADGGGVDVRRALTATDLRSELAIMATRYRAVAVSPWVIIDDELRIVVLDDTVLLAFSKRRQPAASGAGEWRHNLRFGAVPVIVDVTTLDSSAGELARAAMKTLGLRFASVDVIAVDGTWRVLEVNSGVCLERFSATSARHDALAGEVYQSAIAAVFA